eukprot:TRINITY_DN2922_c0_g1_i3.p1 TRINITY_DN2922_c0_g1~~TRINITY_DN2922_c0_g1_i3.p1  ORF type:complete len:257 (+),score=51.52 TRINITY_DN2922_c0_g1_i3:77-847(+)
MSAMEGYPTAVVQKKEEVLAINAAAAKDAAGSGTKSPQSPGGYSAASTASASAQSKDEASSPSDCATDASPGSDQVEAPFFSSQKPSLQRIMMGEVIGGPTPEYFVVKFQEHLDAALREMATIIGERWLAAGGHVGPDMNPNKVEVPPLTKENSASKFFQKVITEGFVIECVDIMCGPPSPMILFKFRHEGKFTGVYTDEDGRTWQGAGQFLEANGVCHITRNVATNEFSKVDIYYNHIDVIRSIHDATLKPSGSR